MNAAGAGGKLPLLPDIARALAARLALAAWLAAESVVATVWLMPSAPTTVPATDAGTDICLLARRTTLPFTRYRASLVPNAFSTWAAVPEAATVIRSREVPPTVKPWPASQVRAWLTSAALGENRASHWAAVR